MKKANLKSRFYSLYEVALATLLINFICLLLNSPAHSKSKEEALNVVQRVKNQGGFEISQNPETGEWYHKTWPDLLQDFDPRLFPIFWLKLPNRHSPPICPGTPVDTSCKASLNSGVKSFNETDGIVNCWASIDRHGACQVESLQVLADERVECVESPKLDPAVEGEMLLYDYALKPIGNDTVQVTLRVTLVDSSFSQTFWFVPGPETLPWLSPIDPRDLPRLWPAIQQKDSSGLDESGSNNKSGAVPGGLDPYYGEVNCDSLLRQRTLAE